MKVLHWTAEEVGPKVEQFLRPLLKQTGLALDFRVGNGSGMDPAFETPDVIVDFSGHDLDVLLANKGELLLALEHVTLEALRARPEEHSRLMFDANDYRMLRVEELRLSAETAAERVKRTGIPFKFSPMNSRERRIIHLALRGDAAVRTESEGLAPRRQVVVYPANHQAARKPAGR
ncbi:MAG TPA: R3H domain-containing nucleic acid-binding protein [Bryobacterales bacterium]|nr:R3H domain-containing nucleic acid-binding protein [Bryobacterales bacterium]